MDIGRTEGVQGPGRIEGNRVDRIQPAPPPEVRRAPDRTEISEAGHLVAEALSFPDVRVDRLTEIRTLIAAGRYQSDERLIGAFENFRSEIRGL